MRMVIRNGDDNNGDDDMDAVENKWWRGMTFMMMKMMRMSIGDDAGDIGDDDSDYFDHKYEGDDGGNCDDDNITDVDNNDGDVDQKHRL